MFREFHSKDIQCVTGVEGLVGRGKFGDVRLGYSNGYGLVAVKCYNYLSSLKSLNVLPERFANELNSLLQTNNENIVCVYGWTKLSNSIGIIMEYLPGGNLRNLLENTQVQLSSLLRLRICLDISKGLTFIHSRQSSQSVVHGNICTDNVVFTEELRCKILDFDCEKLIFSTKNAQSGNNYKARDRFARLYVAPELLRDDKRNPQPSSDTYSFGVVVYEVLSRMRPANIHNIDIYLEQVLNEKVRPDLSPVYEMIFDGNKDDISIYNCLLTEAKRCWLENDKSRPAMFSVRDNLSSQFNRFNPSKVMCDVASVVDEIDLYSPCQADLNCVPLAKLTEESFSKDVHCSFFTYDFDLRRQSQTIGTSFSISQMKPNSPLSTNFSSNTESHDDTVKLLNDNEANGNETDSARKRQSSESKFGSRLLRFRSSIIQKIKKGIIPSNKESDYSVSKMDSLQRKIRSKSESDLICKQNNLESQISHSNQSSRKHSLGLVDEEGEAELQVTAGFLAFNEWRSKVMIFDLHRKTVLANKNLNWRRYGCSTANHNSTLYVISGFNTRVVESFDTRNPESPWTNRSETLEKRWRAACTSSKGRIYVTGGYNGIKRPPKNTGEVYEVARDQWMSIESMNSGRTNHVMVTMSGSIYAIGGNSSCNAESFDPREGKWKKEPPMKTKRLEISAVVLQNKIYTIGGYNNGDLDVVEKYCPYKKKWETIGNLCKPRRNHGSCVVNGNIYAAGGARGCTLLNSVEIFDPSINCWRTFTEVEAFRGGLLMEAL